MTSFLAYPLEIVPVDTETIQLANQLSAEKNHDVHDCFYLALAHLPFADTLVTTDRDFEALSGDDAGEYHNPIPEDILSEFNASTE